VRRPTARPAGRAGSRRSSPTELRASPVDRLLGRIDGLVDRLEAILPPQAPPADWASSIAFRWRKRDGRGRVVPVARPHRIDLADLRGIDRQKALIVRNTEQFVAGRPANNVLLTGARGTGKSSLVKALLNRFHPEGLRLIEVDKLDLIDLPDLVDLVAERPERFVLFCDDLSFEASEPGYKALKVALDGSIAATSENVLIYATSNRRHLMPEFMQENLEYHRVGEEIHPGETAEQKISLSERFGLWVSFYPFDQDEYLEIVWHWLRELGCAPEDVDGARAEALQWALARGSRSGRVAWQFARDYAGRSRNAERAARHGAGR
jgi:hypothetical protein